MLKQSKNKPSRNQSGFAIVESVLLLFVFVIFFAYTLGFFGAIHSGILNSIAARNYAFETFRNRTNVTYFRDDVDIPSSKFHYTNHGYRYHAVTTDNPSTTGGEQVFEASARPISVFLPDGSDSAPNRPDRTPSLNEAPIDVNIRSERASPIYVKIGYGICLNDRCGG